ncbi:hypothetical protein LJC33_06910 [Eubacteriales bacterium OttesenSCG-928-N13]|nr:hypothetical protein [Eubacteriales bacterium OttesenSCG-928-N13]
MWQDRVRDDETFDMLTARLGVPGCMLMRANRVFSPAWLLPGREIDVPDATFCLSDDFPCPVAALHAPATEMPPE